MKNVLFYVLAISCAFILGAFSVLSVDSIRQNGQLANPLAKIYTPNNRGNDATDSSDNRAEQRNSSPRREIVVASTSPSFVEAARIAAPAVVNVYTSRVEWVPNSSPFFGFPFDNPFFEEFLRPNDRRFEEEEQTLRGLGSGVVIDEDGYIVTNNHVIVNADNIFIAFSDGRIGMATIIGVDPETDIAVLKIEMDNLPSIEFGKDEDIVVGAWVLAIGNPYAVGQTVTQGIISAIGRKDVGVATYENFIQTDAAINPGNSGGALINTKGELWGINTGIFSRSGGSQGIGFAIPVNTVLDVVEQLKTDGKVTRGWMGVYLRDIAPTDDQGKFLPPGKEEYRIHIAGIYQDGPADNAKLMNGDEIISIDGETFISSRQLADYLAAQQPGNDILVQYMRGDSIAEAVVTLQQRPVQN